MRTPLTKNRWAVYAQHNKAAKVCSKMHAKRIPQIAYAEHTIKYNVNKADALISRIKKRLDNHPNTDDKQTLDKLITKRKKCSSTNHLINQLSNLNEDTKVSKKTVKRAKKVAHRQAKRQVSKTTIIHKTEAEKKQPGTIHGNVPKYKTKQPPELAEIKDAEMLDAPIVPPAPKAKSKDKKSKMKIVITPPAPKQKPVKITKPRVVIKKDKIPLLDTPTKGTKRKGHALKAVSKSKRKKNEPPFKPTSTGEFTIGKDETVMIPENKDSRWPKFQKGQKRKEHALKSVSKAKKQKGEQPFKPSKTKQFTIGTLETPPKGSDPKDSRWPQFKQGTKRKADKQKNKVSKKHKGEPAFKPSKTKQFTVGVSEKEPKKKGTKRKTPIIIESSKRKKQKGEQPFQPSSAIEEFRVGKYKPTQRTRIIYDVTKSGITPITGLKRKTRSKEIAQVFSKDTSRPMKKARYHEPDFKPKTTGKFNTGK